MLTLRDHVGGEVGMTHSIIRSVLIGPVFLSLVCCARQPESAPKQLPAPRGKYALGRIAYDWVDKTRPETLAKIPGANRELMVYIWYPAEPSSDNKGAEYLPGAQTITKSSESGKGKEFWGDNWPVVASGDIKISATDKPPIAGTKERFPLIVFSPGLGVSSATYTTLIQEVVSHGYIVAAIDPTYEVPVVAFPDGRVVPYLEEATLRHQPTPAGETREQFLKRMHAFDAPHLDKWAADVRFAIDQVALLNAAEKTASPFSGRVDLIEIAAWGHSFGGRAAARACQLDPRIKACLNADGLGPDGPIFVYEGASLPSQPFLWMEVFHEPPTDAQLAPYGTTRKEWDKNHQVQLVTNERQLKDCPGGSYHVRINMPGIEHMSFSDQLLIESEKKEDLDKAAGSLEVVEDYTIAFFDRYLKQLKGVLLEVTTARPASITLEKFGPSGQ
jgi:pimeloyl-ACP methyl ester carboxylesterase